MEAEMLQAPLLGLGEEDEADLTDWNLPLAFMKKRHCEKIEGSKSLAQSWRMKDRVSGFPPRTPGVPSPPLPPRTQRVQIQEGVLEEAAGCVSCVPQPRGAMQVH